MIKKDRDRIYCDLCGKEILRNNKGNKFSYIQGWQTGIHKGAHEIECDVCDSCKEYKLKRWLAYKWCEFKDNYIDAKIKNK